MTVHTEFHFLDQFPEAFLLVHQDGRIGQMNQVARRLFGQRNGQLYLDIFQNTSSVSDLLGSVHHVTPVTARLLSANVEYDCTCIKVEDDILVRCRVPETLACAHMASAGSMQFAARADVYQTAIQSLAELAAPLDDDNFFREFVKYFANAFSANYALVTLRPDPNSKCVKTIAFCANGVVRDNFSYNLAGTPCEKVYEDGMTYFEDRLQEAFPEDGDLKTMGVTSYLGFPLSDSQNRTIGHLCVLDDKPIDHERYKQPLLRIFAARAAVELERKRVLDELKHQQRLLAEAQRIAHLGIWEWNVAANTVTWSDEAYRIIGIEDIGRPVSVSDWQQRIHPDDADYVQKNMALAMDEGIVSPMDYRIIRIDGEIRWLHSQGLIEKNGDGGVTRIIGTVHDITDRKRAEERLTEHRDQLEIIVQQRTEELTKKNEELDAALYQERIATRAKSNFLAKMSHEIRTPINGILGLSQLLLANLQDGEQKEQVRSILYSADTLFDTVNRILDLSKIEAGRFDIKRSVINVKKMVARDFAVYQQQAIDKGNTLRFQIESNVPAYIETDHYVLHHIISNLVHNAVKFTERGKIDVTFGAKKDENGKSVLHVEVADTGIGIPESRQNIVFNAFEQADNSAERKYGGSGLGSAIAKQLCLLLGGRIWFESTVGKGTRFFVELPLVPADKPEKEDADRYETSIKRDWNFSGQPSVLVVDDNEVNRLVAGKILERYRCDVSYAKSGLEAIEHCGKKKFRVILMDIDMPEMNGIDAMKRIRETKLNQMTPVIALTAHAMEGDKENFLAQGMDDFLGKPFRVDQLLDKVVRYCNAMK